MTTRTPGLLRYCATHCAVDARLPQVQKNSLCALAFRIDNFNYEHQMEAPLTFCNLSPCLLSLWFMLKTRGIDPYVQFKRPLLLTVAVVCLLSLWFMLEESVHMYNLTVAIVFLNKRNDGKYSAPWRHDQN